MATSNLIIKAKIMIYDTKAAIIHCPKCEAVYQPTTFSSIWYKHAMEHDENVVKMKDLLNYKIFCNVYKAVYKSEYKEDNNVFAIHGPPEKKPRMQFNTNKSENSFTLTKGVSMRKTTELERNLALFIASHNLPIDILENQFLLKIVGDSNALISSVDKITKIIMPSIAHEIREKVITTSLKHGNMIRICFDETSVGTKYIKCYEKAETGVFMAGFKKITTGTLSIELSKIIMDLIELFKEMNIISATTDGAANARKCATFFVKNDNDTYYCGAHLINLVVQNSMVEKELANICCKVSSLVKYAHTPKGNRVLPIFLKGSVKTRWNSLYLSFITILKNHAKIIQFFATESCKDYTGKPLSYADFRMIENITNYLDIYYQSTSLLSRNDTSISMILPVFLDLLTYTKAYRKRINNDSDDENTSYSILDDTKLQKTRDDLCIEIEQSHYDNVTYSDSEDDIESNFEETMNNDNIEELLEKFQLELEVRLKNLLRNENYKIALLFNLKFAFRRFLAEQIISFENDQESKEDKKYLRKKKEIVKKTSPNKFWKNLEELSIEKIEQLEEPNNNINNKITVRDENDTDSLYSEIEKSKNSHNKFNIIREIYRNNKDIKKAFSGIFKSWSSFHKLAARYNLCFPSSTCIEG